MKEEEEKLARCHLIPVYICIGPDQQCLKLKNWNNFLTHQFKHMLWVLKMRVVGAQ